MLDIERAVIASVCVSAGLWAGWATPVASAVPGLCVHRGEAHAAQQHTTREADSRWHVLHGQLPTCNLDQKDDKDDHDDSAGDGHLLPRRDHEGFHCTWHGCG